MANAIMLEFRAITPQEVAALRDDTPPAPSPTPKNSPRFAAQKGGAIQVALDRLGRESAGPTPAPQNSPKLNAAAAAAAELPEFADLMLPPPAILDRRAEASETPAPRNSENATPALDEDVFGDLPVFVGEMVRNNPSDEKAK
jgi:hypothetical protein